MRAINFLDDNEPPVWWQIKRPPEKQRSDGVIVDGTLK
jgi:hypothetical protein